MTEILYTLIRHMAMIHDRIMTLNDAYEMYLSDKQLHFIVVGTVGIALLLVIYPLFKLLSKHHVLIIAWIYVFTMMVVMTFSVEIGQWLSGTGMMDMDDVVAGLTGFMVLFIIFAIIRAIILGIWNIFSDIKDREV
ncbi:MAG: hypothetical protein K6E72_03780 [Saccharofermentans sp.]|nr:hypothetical protein [Saccharofermentans sp.]